MNRWRQLILGSALAGATTMFTLGAVEIGLRVHEAMQPPKVPRPARGNFWKQHPEVGWVHPPDTEGVWYDDRNEFLVPITISSKGLRDVEHAYEKKPGTYRILVLGDSYVEALQVPLEDTFSRLLENALRPGRTVEVINTGVADWGTDNELLYFRVEGVKYHADLVVLAFTTANDVRNNFPALNKTVPRPNLYKPTFALTEDGKLEHRPPPPELAPPPPPSPAPARPTPTVTATPRDLRIVELVKSRLGYAPPAARPGPLPPRPPGAPPGNVKAQPTSTPAPKKVPTDMLVYSPTYTPEVAEAWRLTKALVAQLRDEVERSGAKFAVVLVNGPWAHYDEPWRRMLLWDRKAQETWRRRQPNEEVTAFLRSAGIPFVDLMDPFEAVKAKEPLFFKMDPHWTSAGHRMAAKVVAEFLTDGHLVPEPNP